MDTKDATPKRHFTLDQVRLAMTRHARETEVVSCLPEGHGELPTPPPSVPPAPWSFVGGFDVQIPSGYDSHSHGESPINGGVNGKIHYKWAILYGYVK